MFGFCQNVEIIHEHHHHFYPSTVPPPPRASSSLSRTIKPAFSNHEGTLSANRSQPLQESYSSKFYHSRRAYLNKSQRGIEVICKKGSTEGQKQRVNLLDPKRSPIKQHMIETLQQNQQSHFPVVNYINLPVFRPIQQANYAAISYKNGLSQFKEIVKEDQIQKVQKLEMSTPSINIYLPSQGSSLRTKKNHMVSAHQLKSSVIGLPGASIFETKKIHRQPQSKNHQKISLCIPLDHHKKLSNHRNAETYREINEDKDSILTKKQSHFLKVFKTQRLLEDAKSIVSHESDDIECLNIQESMIISRSMDYFCHLTPEIQLPFCKLYLAKDNKIHWVVTIRIFQCQHEQVSFKEANLHNGLAAISERQSTKFAILQLYKVLIEGAPPHKNIIFVQEPYENILEQYLAANKMQFRSSPSIFFSFLRDLQEQLYCSLMNFNRFGFNLIEPIGMKDIVMVNGKYKFHSLLKFALQQRSNHPQIVSSMISNFLKMIQTTVRWHF